jgi:hypothetical protein
MVAAPNSQSTISTGPSLEKLPTSTGNPLCATRNEWRCSCCASGARRGFLKFCWI